MWYSKIIALSARFTIRSSEKQTLLPFARLANRAYHLRSERQVVATEKPHRAERERERERVRRRRSTHESADTRYLPIFFMTRIRVRDKSKVLGRKEEIPNPELTLL
jgi:hypothetical protein